MYHLLAGYLLAISFQWTDVLGQDLNTTIDVSKLSKLVMPRGAQSRVVGGEVTTNEKLGGYLIALRYERDFICGGALIHDRIVLTAAHCFIGRPTPSDWLAEGGISRLSDEGVRRNVLKFVRPVSFRKTDMHMDVALVLLSSPMTGKSITKLELCDSHLKTGAQLTLGGWGMTVESGVGPEKLLRTITVPIINKGRCRKSYRAISNITDSMFCASVLGKKDACTFDSGGPLVHNKKICGIVSFGIGCASHRYPGVYTDVMYVKPFIDNAQNQLLKETIA